MSMEPRFVYRPDHPHGPNILDRETGRWISVELFQEMAAALPANLKAEATAGDAELSLYQKELILKLVWSVAGDCYLGADEEERICKEIKTFMLPIRDREIYAKANPTQPDQQAKDAELVLFGYAVGDRLDKIVPPKSEVALSTVDKVALYVKADFTQLETALSTTKQEAAR